MKLAPESANCQTTSHFSDAVKIRITRGKSGFTSVLKAETLHAEGILYQPKTWVSILRVIRDKLMASRGKVALSRVPEGPLVTQKQAV